MYLVVCPQMNEFPSELCPAYCGKGIGIWQLPNQLAPALLYINQFKIQSYVELGCGAGGTFMFVTEVLRKTNALQRATCVDTVAPEANTEATAEANKGSRFFGILHEYLKQHSEYASFAKGNATEYAKASSGGAVPGPSPVPTTGGDGA